MKRFILFGFNNYYPCGGFDDKIGEYNTLAEINDVPYNDYYQIFDCEKRELIIDCDYSLFLERLKEAISNG